MYLRPAFQSTLSSRRATSTRQRERRTHGISIHALLTESDMLYIQAVRGGALFQSTLSSRRATSPSLARMRWGRYFNPRSPHGERLLLGGVPPGEVLISIHALLTESDLYPELAMLFHINFNPRSPHGERPERVGERWRRGCRFQSTLSSRRATMTEQEAWARISISIPALLRESALHRVRGVTQRTRFQSTLSSRRATSPRFTSWYDG